MWRHETKATRPFIRSREFHWIEAHDVFATEKEALAQVNEDMEMAQNTIHKQFGIPFFFFRRPQWDKFPGAVDTYAADSLMPDGRALQLPSTHFLGQNFAKAFNIKFLNEKGESTFGWQTCYGPAISRIYAALFAVHGDDKGLVLPFDFAPLQVIIVPIPKKGNEETVAGKAKELKDKLAKAGLRTEVDVSESTPGFKFNFWEMKGVPLRIEVGGREIESGEYVVCRRDTGEKAKVKEGELAPKLFELGSELSNNIRKKADESFKSKMGAASTMDELKKELGKGGFVAVPFCSMEKDGKACADVVKAETVGDVRGTLFGKSEKPKGKCIACGKEAKELVYVARQY